MYSTLYRRHAFLERALYDSVAQIEENKHYASRLEPRCPAHGSNSNTTDSFYDRTWPYHRDLLCIFSLFSKPNASLYWGTKYFIVFYVCMFTVVILGTNNSVRRSM